MLYLLTHSIGTVPVVDQARISAQRSHVDIVPRRGFDAEQFAAVVQGAILGLFQTIAKKRRISPTRTIVAHSIAALQMIAFALASHSNFNWTASVRPIQILAELTTPAGYIGISATSTFLGFFYLSIAYVVVLLLLFAWAAVCVVRNEWPVRWPLRALRALGDLSATTLFIPVFYLLLASFDCGTGGAASHFWTSAGYVCYSGGHVAQVIVVAILLLAFFSVALLFTLLVVDTNPLSVDLSARTQGRAEATLLICKAVLVILVETFPVSLPSGLLVAVITIVGLIWIFSYLVLMPAYHHCMNQLQLAFACIYLWAAVCLIAGQADPSYNAGITVYLGTIAAAALGVWLADSRAWRLHRHPVVTALSIYDVELKARYDLHAALLGHPFKAVARASMSGSTASTSEDDLEAVSSLTGPTLFGSLDHDNEDTVAAMQRARRTLSPMQLAAAEAVFRHGLEVFPKSAMFHVFAARFYSVFAQNKHLHMSCLLRAARLEPGLDAAFSVFVARQAVELSAGGGGSLRVSSLARERQNKLLADARAHAADASKAKAAFWLALQSPTRDLDALFKLALVIQENIDGAERTFRDLFALGRSGAVLRMYASFLLYAANEPAKAEALLEEAAALDSQDGQDPRLDLQNNGPLRFMDTSSIEPSDNAAVVTISADESNLGAILSANAHTLRLFGYSQSQLLHRAVSVLLPSPIADAHDSFLRAYLKSGAGRVVDFTRVVLGLHKHGHVFPMILTVRESADSAGALVFTGVMSPLTTSHEYIILDADHRVLGCSSDSFRLLGLTPQTLAAAASDGNRPLFTDWVSEGWDAAVSGASGTSGTAIRIVLPAALAMETTTNQRRGPRRRESGSDSSSDGTASRSDGRQVRATLQPVALPGGIRFSVLHWHELSLPVQQESSGMSVSQHPAADPPADSTVDETSNAFPRRTSVDAKRVAVAERHVLSDRRGSVSAWGPSSQGADATEGPSAATGELPGAIVDRGEDSPAQADAAPVVQSLRSAGAGITRAPPHASAAASSSRRGSALRYSVVKLTEASPGVNAARRDDSDMPPEAASRGSLREPSNDPPRSRAAASEDAGDRGSHAGSRKSGATSRKEQKVRGVIKDSDTRLIPSLRLLRIAIVVAALLAIGLAVAMVTVVHTSLSSYSRILSVVGLPVDAVGALVNVIRQARALYLCNIGWVPCALSGGEAAIRSELLRQAATLGETQRILSANADTTGVDFYAHADVTLDYYSLDRMANSLVVTNASSTLLAAVIAFVGAANTLATTPLRDITLKLPALNFVLNNGNRGGTVYTALNQSIVQWLDEAAVTQAHVESVSTSVLISIALGIGLLMLAVITPVLLLVYHSRYEHVEPFLELPETILQRLQIEAGSDTRKLESALMDGGDGVALDDGDSGSETDEDGAGSQAGSTGGADERDDQGNLDWDKVLTKLGITRSRIAKAAPKKKSACAPLSDLCCGSSASRYTALGRTRPAARSRLPLALLFFRFAFPLLCLIGFFSAIYVTSINTVRDASHVLDTGVAVELLADESEEMYQTVIRVVRTVGTPETVAPLTSLCDSLADSLSYHLTLLQTGAPSYELGAASGALLSGAGLPAGNAAAIKSAMFGDACPFVATHGDWLNLLLPAFSFDACKTVADGAVTLGLSQSVTTVLDRSRGFCADRAHATVLDSVSGLGTTVSVAGTTNYSIPGILTSPEMADLLSLAGEYVAPAWRGLADMYNRQGTSVVASQQSFLVVFVAAFLSAFVVFVVAFYLPAINAVNYKITRQRTILLHVPVPLLRSFGGFGETVTNILQRADTGRAARS